MKPDGSSFEKKHDGTWSLSAGAVEPDRESGARHRSRSPRGDRSQGQAGTNRRGLRGPRFPVPIAERRPSRIVLFGARKTGRPSNSITEKPNVWIPLLRSRLLLWPRLSSVDLVGLRCFDLLRAP